MPPPQTPAKVLQISRRHAVIVDADLYDELASHKWTVNRYCRSFYATRQPDPPRKRPRIHMHRWVAKTPSGQVCHHRNRNSLDNRAVNLFNMTPQGHTFLHANDSLLIKFKEITGETPTKFNSSSPQSPKKGSAEV